MQAAGVGGNTFSCTVTLHAFALFDELINFINLVFVSNGGRVIFFSG